jgi:multicomponent Na+:H+ antiporter subunit D
MVAPTPVSALLHAVAVVKVGVFSILRVVFFIYGPEMMTNLNLSTPAAYIAGFTLLMASVYALTRDNLKARLAYSTVSQLSYIILGAVLVTPSSMVGSVMHIASHAFSKITLFFCAGSLYVAAHKTEVSQLSGIGKKMPLTMLAFFIGALNMIGIPPFACFMSKWYLALGTIEAHQLPLLFVLIASTVLNAGYFMPIVYKAFFEEYKEDHHNDHGQGHGHGSHGHGNAHHEEIKESNFIVIPLLLTALGSLLLGIFPDYFLTLAKGVLP